MGILKAILNAIFGMGEISSVDVEEILTDRARQHSEKLNWRTSIVDLLKLLDLDSSFEARRELATELGDKGGYTGTAEENIQLHKRVMQRLAENGGSVPPDLL